MNQAASSYLGSNSNTEPYAKPHTGLSSNTQTEKRNAEKHNTKTSGHAMSLKTTMPLVALYCGSRAGNKPVYREQAILLAQQLAQNNLGVVYGGASIGLMGQVADTVLEYGAEVVGVIPAFLLQNEIAHATLTELYVVDTMHERKAMMAERASAFVALPGGLGTFEEILEVATWGQLAQHSKPIVLFNVQNYYQGLIDQLAHAVNEGFLSPEHCTKVVVCQTVEEVMQAIQLATQQPGSLQTEHV